MSNELNIETFEANLLPCEISRIRILAIQAITLFNTAIEIQNFMQTKLFNYKNKAEYEIFVDTNTLEYLQLINEKYLFFKINAFYVFVNEIQ